MMIPDVDVIVVAFGAPELLDTCLGSLDRQLPIVVVDNSSDPQVEEVSVRHGARYIDPERNLGFAAGVNVGLSLPRPEGTDVLLLNPDATVTPDGVARLHGCLHRQPRRACAAPAQIEPGGGVPVRVAWPFPTPLGAWVEATGLGRLRHGANYMIGSVLLLRAGAVAEVGPFDERYFLYSEETDWQRRAFDLGWTTVLCPEVIATHVGAGTGGDATTRDVHFHGSHERYIRKHYGTGGWWVYRTGVMAGGLVRAIFLPGERGRAAAARFDLYRRGPSLVESQW